MKFAQRISAEKQIAFQVGCDIGRQQMCDALMLVLHDDDIMGKDVFGKNRLIKVMKAADKVLEKLWQAWDPGQESDYCRAKLDEAIKQIMHDDPEFVPFEKRYPAMFKITYGGRR